MYDLPSLLRLIQTANFLWHPSEVGQIIHLPKLSGTSQDIIFRSEADVGNKSSDEAGEMVHSRVELMELLMARCVTLSHALRMGDTFYDYQSELQDGAEAPTSPQWYPDSPRYAPSSPSYHLD